MQPRLLLTDQHIIHPYVAALGGCRLPELHSWLIGCSLSAFGCATTADLLCYQGDDGNDQQHYAQAYYSQQPSLRPAFTGSDPTADEEQYALALERAVAEPVSPDWQPADLIYEVALKEEGYGLNLSYERLAVAGVSDLYRVAAADSGQHFLISLAARLEDAILSAGLLDGQTRFYCLDSAIADNPSLAVNVALRCGSGNFKTI